MSAAQSNVSLRSRLAEQLLNDLGPPDHHEVLLRISSMAGDGRKTAFPDVDSPDHQEVVQRLGSLANEDRLTPLHDRHDVCASPI